MFRFSKLNKQQIPLAIYLDQNKWIDLSLAYHRHPRGQPYKEILQEMMWLVENNKVLLPLSASHLIEARKSKNPERRKRLACVMSLLSKGITIAPQHRMAKSEILRSLSVLYEKPIAEIPSAFGIGIPFAFGQTHRVYEKSTGKSVTIEKQLQQQLDQFLTSKKNVELFFVNEINESQNSKIIQQYEASSTEFVDRVEKFRSDVKKFDKNAHKRAYVANLLIEIYPELSKALMVYGKTFGEFLELGQEKLVAFFDSVPSLAVEIELVIERNENWSRKIHKNDKEDISFLTTAIPYCDIVVSEHFFAMSAINRKLDKKYNTIIFEKLTSLSSYLAQVILN